MKAFNCNDARKNWTSLILAGSKSVATRNTASLGSLVGQRVGLIRTGCGKAQLVGFVTVSGVIDYKDERAFRRDYSRHHVPPDLRGFEWSGRKVGYLLKDPEAIEPKLLPASCRGIVIRHLPS